MADFFSKFVEKRKDTPPKSIQERITIIWTSLLGCTLKNTQQNLNLFHEKMILLIQAINEGMSNGDMTFVMQALAENQIPSNLVNLGFADVPHGLVNEVTLFFTEISKGKSALLLTQQFVIKPLNTFLESAQPSDATRFNQLIETLISHITNVPDDIQLFITSETSAPLIHQFTQMIVSKYQVMGDALVQIMCSARTIHNLLEFLTTFSPLIATCIEFIRDCVDSKSTDAARQRFLMSIDTSIGIAPDEYKKAFMKYFNDSVLRNFIYEEKDPQAALQNAIYILASFSTPDIIRTIIVYLKEHLPAFIVSENQRIQFLALRAASLMLEHAIPVFPQAPEDFKVSLDFMGLLNAEWFVKSDINKQLSEASARVSLALSRSQIVLENSVDFEAIDILKSCFEVLKNFATNSLDVNLALTDLLTGFASVWGSNSTFFTLSSECKEGLFAALQDLCTHYTGRLGSKPGISQLINQAYDKLAAGEEGENENEKYFISLAIVLEFIKELHSTAQSKNMLNQSETLVPM